MPTTDETHCPGSDNFRPTRQGEPHSESQQHLEEKPTESHRVEHDAEPEWFFAPEINTHF